MTWRAGTGLRFVECHCLGTSVDDNVANRRLKRGAQIGDILFAQGAERLGLPPQGGLEAGKGKMGVLAPKHGPGEIETVCVPRRRMTLNLRTAGETEGQKFRGLVESLAKRVVKRRAETAVTSLFAHHDKLGMAARDQQQQIGCNESFGQANGQRMAFEMIDRQQRQAPRRRYRFRRGQSHHQPTNQPGTCCCRDGIDILKAETGLAQRLFDQRIEHLHMGPRRDFRNHAAKGAMLFELGPNDVGQYFAIAQPAPPNDRRRRLVATCLYAENGQGRVCACILHGASFNSAGIPFRALMTFGLSLLASGARQVQSRQLTIGTRGSPLALVQAHQLRDRLRAAHGLDEDEVVIETFRTTGDKIWDKSLRDAGGKGLFTKEIEDALLSGSVDLAVHSMKDVPTELPAGLTIECMLPREDVRDAFISPKAEKLADLPEGAVIGTASLRRQAQVKLLRPDLEVAMFRGNVQTRLRKLSEGVADATFLALAGLRRLELEDKATSIVPTSEMLPAIAQGAIGIEIRQDDAAVSELLTPLNDTPTALCVAAERAFLARLDGSCRTPIAGIAEIKTDALHFRGQILTPDGGEAHGVECSGALGDGERMGRDAAEDVLSRAGPDFFRSWS